MNVTRTEEVERGGVLSRGPVGAREDIAARTESFRKLGAGIFFHYGLYSLLGQGEWAYLLRGHSWPEYGKLAESFTASEFDAVAWADFVRRSGGRYAVLTARHHEGFSLYDTRGLNTFDAPHSAAGRDLVAEFVTACRGAGITPLLYHTTGDWWWRGRSTKDLSPGEFDEYLDYLHASVEVLCRNYGEIGGFWFDGNWNRPDDDWKEDRLYAMIRKHQPRAVLVNNTGLHARGAVGHPELDVLTFEQAVPGKSGFRGTSRPLAMETCETVNGHWGYTPSDFLHKPVAELIRNFCACRRYGANYLLNVGPLGNGSLPDLDRATILRLGDWLREYGAPLMDGDPVEASTEKDDFLMEYQGEYYYFATGLQVGGDHDVTASSDGNSGWRTIRDLPIVPSRICWTDDGSQANWEKIGEGALTLNPGSFYYGDNPIFRVAKIS